MNSFLEHARERYEFDSGPCLCCRVDGVGDNQGEEFVVAGIDDVLNILKSDYENAYFVTGIFIYFPLSCFVIVLIPALEL